MKTYRCPKSSSVQCFKHMRNTDVFVGYFTHESGWRGTQRVYVVERGHKYIVYSEKIECEIT